MKRFSFPLGKPAGSFGNAARWGVALSAVALGISASSCLRGPSGPDEGPIRIAVILPFTGALTSSQDWVKGTRIAVNEINAAGGPIPGRLVELVEYDSELNPARSAQLARQAIDDGAVAIIGDGFSGGALAVYRVAGPEHIPTGSCCATSTSLTDVVAAAPADQRTFFRATSSDEFQAIVVSDIVLDGPLNDGGLVCNRLAVLYLQDDYGLPFANDVRDEVARRRPGLTTTLIPFPPAMMSAARDYEAPVAALRASRADCAVAIAYPTEMGFLVRGYLQEPTATPITFIGTDGIQEQALFDQVGVAQLNDGRLTLYGSAPLSRYAPENLGLASDNYLRFVDHYRAAYGTYPPVPYITSSYDIAALMLLGIAQARSTEPEAITAGVRAVSGPDGVTVSSGRLAEGLRALQSDPQVRINYDGAAGSVDLDVNGDVRGPFEIWGLNEAATAITLVRPFRESEFTR
jgi:branched-chain amino acid transport system substrate-binding protein